MGEAHSIRAIAEYQLMSDVDGLTWMRRTLGDAKAAGEITEFTVTGAHPGPYDLVLVQFTVDVPFNHPGTQFPTDIGYPEAQERMESFLNGIIGDSDVNVRWVSPVEDTLPREDGEISTSAEFGQGPPVVEITYTTEADGSDVDRDLPAPDWPRTLHGPFVDMEEAEAWMNARPDDTDVEDMKAFYLNAVRPEEV